MTILYALDFVYDRMAVVLRRHSLMHKVERITQSFVIIDVENV